MTTKQSLESWGMRAGLTDAQIKQEVDAVQSDMEQCLAILDWLTEDSNPGCLVDEQSPNEPVDTTDYAVEDQPR